MQETSTFRKTFLQFKHEYYENTYTFAITIFKYRKQQIAAIAQSVEH